MPALPRSAAALALTLLAGACAAPEADWPRLLPTEALLAEPAAATRPEAQTPQAATDPLLARAESLRARAERLRRLPVIDPATAARLQAAQPGA